MSAQVRQSQKQLLSLQREGDNKHCFECRAANPQWASPKYGVFICLECAGTHRSLGVHISFVRSVTMDQFKPEELRLMEIGGNHRAREFFTANGIKDDVSIVDKYNSTVAEDYREKLAAELKGESWERRDRPVHIPQTGSKHGGEAYASTNSRESVGSGAQSDKSASSSAFQQFAREPAGGGSEPTLNELATDAIGAISSGWSWFSSTLTRTVTETTDTYIRPGVRQFAESEYGENARRAVEQFGKRAREAGAYSADQFNKYAGEAMANTAPVQSEFAHLFDGLRPKNASDQPVTSGSSDKAANETAGGDEKTKTEAEQNTTDQQNASNTTADSLAEKPRNTYRASAKDQ